MRNDEKLENKVRYVKLNMHEMKLLTIVLMLMTEKIACIKKRYMVNNI